MGLQKSRGMAETGTMNIEWKRAVFSDNKIIKVIVDSAILTEGECNINFSPLMKIWKDLLPSKETDE